MEQLRQDKKLSNVILGKKKNETRYLKIEINSKVKNKKYNEVHKLFLKNLNRINTSTFYNVEKIKQSLYRKLFSNDY